MDDASVFQSLVAMSQAISEVVHSKDVHVTPSQQVLYHKGQALRSLQDKISNSGKVDEATMFTVLNLMALDVRNTWYSC